MRSFRVQYARDDQSPIIAAITAFIRIRLAYGPCGHTSLRSISDPA
jgi:hypothetical protein